MKEDGAYPFYDPRCVQALRSLLLTLSLTRLQWVAASLRERRYRIAVDQKTPTDVAQSIQQRLSKDLFYHQLKARAWQQYNTLLSDSKATGSDEQKMIEAIESSRAMDVIENAALVLSQRLRQAQAHSVRSAGQTDVLETLRKRWQQNMNDELRAIAEETRAPFCRGRKQPRRSEGLPDVNDTSLEGSMAISPYPALEDGDSAARFLFDADDLLEFVIAATTPREKSAQLWGMINTSSQVPSFVELQQRFHALGYWHEQVDSHDNSFRSSASTFSTRYTAEGQAILDRYSLSMAQQYARRGIPRCLRAQMYRLLLQLPKTVSAEDRQAYQQLKNHVDQHELLSDDLYIIDINLTNDDPRYFVFYELLDEVMMCFSRDIWVHEHSPHQFYQPIHTKDEALQDAMPHFPLNGVHPYKGLTSFAAPVAYIFDSAEEVYFVFRAMYMRYWTKLTAISSRPDTLIHLLKLFENLLCTVHPELMLHLQTLGFPPVKKASAWIQHGFAGTLEVEQILLLWDRVLAFDELTILPILAAAIFTFRGSALLRAENADQAAAIMSRCTSLKVTPLLQAFLFPEVFNNSNPL